MSSRLPVVGVPGSMQRRLGAVTLVGESPVLLFGALALWGLASAHGDPNARIVLWLGIATTVLAVVAAATMRRPFGVTLGWLVQLLTLVAAFVDPFVLVVVAVFLPMWVWSLWHGAKMDALTRDYERRAAQDTASSTH
ncbi:DUF4233 domain-containing protein [Mobilicoccus pelagius]|uniref:DUF4233 domain-containing protein n=1 Tax=Mobilicoccus pelagius NBRC 104925 TaxID=1089455 RepID=H5UNK4_9MICO|nr:DUF4233 domain-containing protein [Mobilicoccus pelagius]GAB47312.1 hypothetical protein MOPEL_009_00020 [Mobilicoccus pelagius NBRC 104925]